MKELTLDVSTFNKMPIENIISLYQQGYKLDEPMNLNKIKKLAVSCTTPIALGTNKVLTASSTGGSGTITYHWTISKPDGTSDTTLAGATPTYNFNQLGNYTVSVYSTDSCPAGSQRSDTVMCTVNVSSQGCTSTGVYTCDPTRVGYEVDNCGNSRVNASCTGSTSADPCLTCDKTKNICILGQCLPKNYILYGGVAFLAIMMFKK